MPKIAGPVAGSEQQSFLLAEASSAATAEIPSASLDGPCALDGGRQLSKRYRIVGAEGGGKWAFRYSRNRSPSAEWMRNRLPHI